MIYWINLESCKFRKDFMLSQFDKYKMENKRISAIQVPKIPPLIQKKFRLNRFEYSCLLSHIQTIHKTNDNDSFSIIMEDDICIPYPVNFEKIIADAPKDWEVLQLFVSHSPSIRELFSKHRQGIKWVPWQPLYFGASVYIVNLKTKSKINKNNIENFKERATSENFIYSQCKTYTYTYPLFYSNIECGSVIHPSHLPKHEDGNKTIRNIQQQK